MSAQIVPSGDVTAAILDRVEKSVDSIRDSVQAFDVRLHLLERTDKEVQRDVRDLTARVRELEQKLTDATALVQGAIRQMPVAEEAKWRAWAEIGVAIGVVASLVLHVLKMTGVTP